MPSDYLSNLSTSERPQLPKLVPGWEAIFRDGLTMLEIAEHSPEMRDDAIRSLDAAVGLRQRGGQNHGGWRGETLAAQAGLRGLPIYLVRRVEYEAAMRRLNLPEMAIGALHANFEDRWYYGDVHHREHAIAYLLRATVCGNRFAARALAWLAPERAAGVSVHVDGARDEFLRAVHDGDRGRAVELGRMMEGAEARGGGGFGRPDATQIVKMRPREQKAMAANNIGFLLLHGAGGVTQDVREGMRYYEMAVAWGSAAAASNLGFVYYVGAGDVRRDAVRAKQLYELAIERGERNFAPRNLAILLHHGGRGVRADVAEAARWLLVGMREGDEQARAKCRKSLALLMRSWRMRFVGGGVRAECQAALHGSCGGSSSGAGAGGSLDGVDEGMRRGDEIEADLSFGGGRGAQHTGVIGGSGPMKLDGRAKALARLGGVNDMFS